MYQPCKTCPFRESPVEPGALDWLVDIMGALVRGSLDHTCHLTDKKADLYAGRKKQRECIGYLGMMKNCGGQAIGRRAMRKILTGEIDWDKVPTKGVFKSPRDAVRFHAKAAGLKLPEIG